VHLDFLRGLAALLVVIEHLRAFLFVPFTRLKAPGILTKIFYLVTGLGHQAVMIFFVLSGFLVGGSVITALQKGKWSWRAYLLRRMSRLWVVLIPALFLTLLWDKLGFTIAPEGYQGVFRELYHSGPTPTIPADWSIGTFFGNVFFFQTILVPCFGTNGPLWSLANEFWYYLLFPILLILVVSRTRIPVRIICLLLAAGMLLFLPMPILLGGVIWLLGVGVFYLIQIEMVRRITSHPVWLILSLLMTMSILLASRSGKIGAGADLLIGIGCAAFVAGLAVRSSETYFYGILSAGASEISYTLYLVHFPVLALIFFGFFKGIQMPPDLISAGCFGLILAGILLYSAVIWWVFERNTDRARKVMESLLLR